MKPKLMPNDRMSVEPIEFKSDTRQRHISFKCVTCGDVETTIYQLKTTANRLPDVVIELIRCNECTKLNKPLPKVTV